MASYQLLVGLVLASWTVGSWGQASVISSECEAFCQANYGESVTPTTETTTTPTTTTTTTTIVPVTGSMMYTSATTDMYAAMYAQNMQNPPAVVAASRKRRQTFDDDGMTPEEAMAMEEMAMQQEMGGAPGMEGNMEGMESPHTETGDEEEEEESKRKRRSAHTDEDEGLTPEEEAAVASLETNVDRHTETGEEEEEEEEAKRKRRSSHTQHGAACKDDDGSGEETPDNDHDNDKRRKRQAALSIDPAVTPTPVVGNVMTPLEACRTGCAIRECGRYCETPCTIMHAVFAKQCTRGCQFNCAPPSTVAPVPTPGPTDNTQACQKHCENFFPSLLSGIEKYCEHSKLFGCSDGCYMEQCPMSACAAGCKQNSSNCGSYCEKDRTTCQIVYQWGCFEACRKKCAPNTPVSPVAVPGGKKNLFGN